MKTLKEQNESTRELSRLETHTVKAIKMLTATLPKCILDFLPEILTLICRLLADRSRECLDEDIDMDSDGKFEIEAPNVLEFDYFFHFLAQEKQYMTVILWHKRRSNSLKFSWMGHAGLSPICQSTAFRITNGFTCRTVYHRKHFIF